MDSSRLTRKLVLGVVVLFLVPAVAVAGLLLILYRRGVIEDPAALVVATGVGLLAVLGYVAAVSFSLGRGVVRSIEQLHAGTELIATVNPDHRLEIRTGDELEWLARDINRLADRAREGQGERERAVRESTDALERERTRLSAVVQSLGDGVLVTTLDGRVLLANGRAHELVVAPPSSLVGRPLDELFDRTQVIASIARVTSGAGPPERVAVRAPGAGPLEAVITPFVDREGRLAGVVFCLREAPPSAHGRAIDAIEIGELLAMARRRAKEAASGLVLDVEAVEPDLPLLRGEVSALSAALARLIAAITVRVDAGRGLRVTARRQGDAVVIEIAANGSSGIEALEQALDAPPDPAAAPRATREIVREHQGEVWAFTGGGGFGFRVVLPLADDGAPRVGFAGAGLMSAAGTGESHADRADAYDFSLVDEMTRQVSGTERDRPLDRLTCAVIDLETTGLDPGAGDRIVSIAAVRIRDGSIRRGEVLDLLVNPRRPIPVTSVRFHGITDAVVAHAPPIELVLPAVLRFLEGSVIVGHQVWFDLRFLDLAARRLGLRAPAPGRAVVDTAMLSRIVHRALEGHGLDAVAGRLGVVVRGRHSALGDALTTAEVFVRLVEILRNRGIRTLGDALDASRKR